MKIADTYIVAVVVLYNPEIDRLKLLLKSTINQVNKIILIDNTDDKGIKMNMSELIYYQQKVSYHSLHSNHGIAYAQNVGISFSEKLNATHVLLLDQDSILPTNMVQCLVKHERFLIDNGKSVAAIGPSFQDEKTGKITGAIRIYPLFRRILTGLNQPIQTDYLIASGSLINLKVIESIGGMENELFIDLVDIEWCERAKKRGFLSYVAPDIILQHNIGNEAKKIAGKNIIIHSDFRHYYIVRNTIYLGIRNRLSITHCVFLLLRLPLFIIVHIINSNSKYKKLKLLLVAIKDGVIGRMGKGYYEKL